MTFAEALLTLMLGRFLFRMVMKAGRFAMRRERPAAV